MTPSDSPALDTRIVRQASQWWVDLQSDDVTAAHHQACVAWRAKDPEHERAWKRVQAVAGQLQDVPESLIKATLLPPSHITRRRAIKRLALFATVGATGILAGRAAPWAYWRADEATRVGEWRQVVLPDGSTVALNTDTSINVLFGQDQRRIDLLDGEILVTTATDPAPAARPFVVQTAHSRLRALGTRFLVRQESEDSELQVFEGAVEVRAINAGPINAIIYAGERVRFDRRGVASAQPAEEASTSWTRGMLMANDMPLRRFLVELSRYRRGHLGCEDSVAALPVSGTFPLGDIDRVLTALAHELPIDVQRYTNYWIRLTARQTG